MPKKKFINKKNAVSFQLVHRSQQDPLVADDKAPQRVLLPFKDKETPAERSKRIDEQHKYGIYFNDDENYLDNLKDSKDNKLEWPEHVQEEIEKRKVKFNLPNEVFASDVEELVGMLNKAMPISGPQLHLDPDVVAAMDEDFDYDDPENQLEDNFIELAEGLAEPEFIENDEGNYFSSDFDDDDDGLEENDEVGSLPGSSMFEEEEKKSRFTNYSMSSSVIERNEHLTLLDRRFEKMYAEYDKDAIEALECEEVEGHISDTDMLLALAEDFRKSKQKWYLDKEKESNIKKNSIDLPESECKEDVVHKMDDNLEDLSDTKSEEDLVKYKVKQPEKWDCESILTTYSNTKNLPQTIPDLPKKSKNIIKINSKTGIPLDTLGQNKLTVKTVNRLDEDNEGSERVGSKSIYSTLSQRSKYESPEEKRMRKKAFREFKKERKVEKKTRKLAVKEDTKRQIKIALNNRNNVQGNKIV